jgi:hypothetical protein
MKTGRGDNCQLYEQEKPHIFGIIPPELKMVLVMQKYVVRDILNIISWILYCKLNKTTFIALG